MAPGASELYKVFDECYKKKIDCIWSHSCAGWNYSVYDGHFDSCGTLSPFYFWDKIIDAKKYEESYQLFIGQYNIEFGSLPTGDKVRKAMN